MEDYEYFVVLEKLTDRNTIKKIVDTVAPNVWDFSKNPNEFLSACANRAFVSAARHKNS
jgi:hypothetical protein